MDRIRATEAKALAKKNIIKEAILSGESEVQKFYDGAVAFITGGSGFIGKQLIQKLIRSTNVKKIYMLLRPKKGKSINERLKKILEDPVYADLHNEIPSFVDKIVPIEGDVANLNLGMDEQSWSILTKEVTIIIHAAATINFVETIKIATLTNIRGTREILKLARACDNIKSVVHVSTAFSNATKSRIKQEVKEDFYKSPISPDALITFSESFDDDTLNNMITPLMEDWPNSYTFTKAVTEELVRSQAKDLPICIVRPAIVIAAYEEPAPGWVDKKNVFGPSGNIVTISLGVTHTTFNSEDIVIDFVPVDIVNNAILVAAWKTSVSHRKGDSKTLIYTVTGARNPLKWRDLTDNLIKESYQLVPTKAVWYCFVIQTRYKFMYFLLSWLLHFIPAMIIDGCCMLVGVKPRLFKLYKMMATLSSVFAYFTTNDWIFRDSNTLNLYNQLSKTDKLLYNFDTSSICNNEMIWSWCYGAKKYIIEDNMNETDYAMKKQFWLRIAHYIIFPLYIYSLYKIVSLAFLFTYNVLGFFVF